jgi:hypothetical protein
LISKLLCLAASLGTEQLSLLEVVSCACATGVTARGGTPEAGRHAELLNVEKEIALKILLEIFGSK